MKFYPFVFLFFSLFFHSQRYTSQWYGMDEGLPQNSIKDIIKDQYGFIWLSTDGGIVRYDGKSFLLHNEFKISSLSFKDFLRDKNGGITCFNNGEKDCVLISNRTATILPQEKIERTYALTKEAQYKRFYKNSLIDRFYPEVNYYYIKTDAGIYYFDNHTIEYKPNKGLSKIIKKNFLHTDLKGAFEHDNVVYIADPNNRTTMILKNGNVSYDNQPSLYNDPETRIYWHQGTKQVFLIKNGDIYISKIVNNKPRLTFLMGYKNIEKNFIYCMYFDEEANKLYFGNVVKGLNIVNLSNFYVSQKNIPFLGEFVYEALPFSPNSVITKQGIEYYKDRINKIYNTVVKYDKRYLLYDNSQNLLYLEYNKIQRRLKSSNYQKKDSVKLGKSVEGLFKIGTNYMVNVADYKFNYYLKVFPDDKFKKPSNIFKFKKDINFVTPYNNDLFYVGTSNGIYLLSLLKNKIVKYLAKDLPIKEIQRTKDGNFWFTTHNKGFYLIKNNEVIKMPDDKNGYIANAHHILEDTQGMFWISSNNGLFKIPEKILLNYAQNRNSKVTYYRYTKENGFVNNEFNGSANPSGNILQNGEFVFPSMEGFVFFKPHEIKSHYPKSDQLYIERAKIGNNMISFKDTIRLKSDYKNVDIFLDLPYYYDIENVYLEAKLENGKNSKWEEIKNDKKFTLNPVNPGNYTLLVRFLIAEDGKFAYKKIFLEIKPFFYQTMLFKIFIMLLILTVILMIIQMRTNFLRIKNKKLKNNLYSKDQELKETSNTLEITKNKLKNEAEYQQKIMESISHDITTPVRFIALLSQKLSTAEDAQIQKKYFDGIYKTSEQLFKFTLGLKEYTELYKEENILESEEYALYDLVEDKKLLFEEMAMDNNTTIANLCDPDLRLKTNRNIFSAMLHNLIDNAVKNTTDGKITITAAVKDAQVEIGISDTGKGMSQSQIEYYSHVFESMETENFVFKNYGLGLHMVIQLSKKINAKISFHENVPKGTVVKIFLKID
ncbi:Signal transduction histidine kinase [Chryseobacterium soldanellicola]|uniref:Signal transduction histidine kinase n=1 Tax=Chryseobacterium soldanellicola TaxID=311333 RepID=A0A1H1FS88_9FLAO|nr:HAMP domain-containing sensor histidine kinase [Chryseobacterium soldanellicola]SDR03638.1 Signal transduction histidine kinase [Chryseobacterium soldanellicola]